MNDKEIKLNKVEVDSKEQLDELYNGSAFTIEGFDTSEKNIDILLKWFNKFGGVSNPLDMYIIKGSVMNKEYGLTEDNAYPDNTNIMCIKLKNIKDVMRIVTPRFDIRGRWFDDVVDNNRYRQKEIDGIEDEEEEY